MKKQVLTLASLFVLSMNPAFAEYESVGEGSTIWSKKQIKVCWGGTESMSKTFVKTQMSSSEQTDLYLSSLISSMDPASKLTVKKTINQEYNAATIGITFSGWKSCLETPDADVILFTIKDDPHTAMDQMFSSNLPIGQATIGQGGELNRQTDQWNKSDKKLKPFVFLRKVEPSENLQLSTAEALKITALHEFGHLLGLRHEHARLEAKNDLNCKVGGVRLGEEVDLSTDFYSVYDPNSIMSYCHVYLLKYKVGLDFFTTDSKANNEASWLTPAEYSLNEKLNFRDQSLVTVSKIPGKENLNFVQVKIGISKGDLHTLRCMYGFYSPSVKNKTCHSYYKPI
jgi:hypothetical protein